MILRKPASKRVDELLDELLVEYRTPEDILGEPGLLKQLSKRLFERALVGELSHHLKTEEAQQSSEQDPAHPSQRNSRNGFSKKTIHIGLWTIKSRQPIPAFALQQTPKETESKLFRQLA